MLVVFGLLVMFNGLANGMEEKSCDARQNIRVQLTIGGGSDGPIIASLVAVVLVLTVVVGAYCIHKRGTPPQAPDADESPELEYADVTILKKMDKPPEVPEEVKYGKVCSVGGFQTNQRERQT
ncbi:hypothetical protein J4Q44_G00313700 [Coregonus suidteri]|uniref:Uncharacterized protein n=1 Tax=Coregonus suidteri TaxID=861788 RepID=A0AAN8L5F0_9TELE